MMVWQFVVLFLVHMIFRETLMETGVTISVLLQKQQQQQQQQNKSTTISHGLYSNGPQEMSSKFSKLSHGTTYLWLMVPLVVNLLNSP